MTDSFQTGCHIDGNYMNVDEFNLEIIELARTCGFAEPLPAEDNTDYSQVINEIADSAVDFLNDTTIDERPAFTYWTIENSALYLVADVDDAAQDDSVVRCEWYKSECPSYILEINDHGNATLYQIERKEIWSVV